MILANPPRGITDALAGLAARADSTPLLREIRVPTLVVCGEEDVITPPAEAEAMHAANHGQPAGADPEGGTPRQRGDAGGVQPVLEAFLRQLG